MGKISVRCIVTRIGWLGMEQNAKPPCDGAVVLDVRTDALAPLAILSHCAVLIMDSGEQCLFLLHFILAAMSKKTSPICASYDSPLHFFYSIMFLFVTFIQCTVFFFFVSICNSYLVSPPVTTTRRRSLSTGTAWSPCLPLPATSSRWCNEWGAEGREEMRRMRTGSVEV